MPGDPTAHTPPEGYVALGRLGRAFQLQGGLRFHAVGEAEGDALASLEQLFVEGYGPARLRELRRPQGAPVVYLEGVRDREAARALVNARVFGAEAAVHGARARRPELDRAAALDGAPVWSDGAQVGRVIGVERGGPFELARVRTAAGDALVPLEAPYVRVTTAGLELVDAPEGILDPA